MSTIPQDDPGRQVRGLVAHLNRAWREDRVEEIHGLLAEDVVIVHPGFAGRAAGREACVESYRELGAALDVREYEELDHQVDLWGETAVATYRFRIAYVLGDAISREEGRDLLVLTRAPRAEHGWLVVWRTVLVPGAEAES